MSRYVVHGRHATTVDVPADFQGMTVVGKLPALIVELVPTRDNPFQRSVTHIEVVETPEKMAAGLALFRDGVELELRLVPVEGGAP